MDDHQQHLRRGFNWLGGATVIAKLIDFGTIVAVLLFLTKEQVGVAALVISIGMVVESMNGLGTGEAIVQAKNISRLQLDSVFWFVMGAALLVAAVLLLVAPQIQALYGIAGMAAYFIAVAIKQPLVGAALIPLTIMNRDLQYERIAIVNVCATLAAALTRLGLAIAGAGTWALVVGFSAHGLYVLIGAQLARPFWPHWRFQRTVIAPLIRFGIRASTSNGLQQMFKNVDYLLIGWFYGPSPLAVYRVAFDIAMEPAGAIATLVNRTALPVFARVSSIRDHLVQAVSWSLGRIVVLVAPLMVAVILAADPLTALIHDRQGQSYAAAAVPLKLLAAAALLRASMQLIYPLMLATGRPGSAARLSATTLVLLSVGILVAGFSFPAQSGIIAVSAVWLVIYPVLLVWAARYVKQHWGIRAGELSRAFIVPGIGVGALLALVEIARWLPYGGNPESRLGIVVAATALTYAGIFMYSRPRLLETG